VYDSDNIHHYMVDNKSRTLITDKAKYRNETEREAVVFDGKDCYDVKRHLLALVKFLIVSTVVQEC